jgi:hypothetical protein
LEYKNFDIEIQKGPKLLSARLRDNDYTRALGGVSFDVSEIQKLMKLTQSAQLADTAHYRLGKNIYKSIFHASSQSWADEDVLPGDTLHLRLAVAQAVSQNKDQRLRLIFRTNADSMPDTPIEFLCYRYSESPLGVFLALDPQLSVVRMPLTDTSFGKTKIPFPLRILVVMSRAKLEEDFDLEREKRLLQNKFEGLDYLAVDFMGTEGDPESSWAEVKDRIAGVGIPDRAGFSKFYSIFHFIGHGKFVQGPRKSQGYIYLKDGPVAGYTLEGAFSRQGNVKMVILQSCETASTDDFNAFHGVAQQLVSGKVPCVLGMQYKISAEAAHRFVSLLYEGWLVKRLPLEEAITQARVALFEAYRNDAGVEATAWAAPVVFLTSEIEVVPREEPVLSPERQARADAKRARIATYEEVLEETEAKLAQPLMPNEKAASEFAKQMFEKKLAQEEEELGQVLGTYVNIGNAYASPGAAGPVPIPLLLHAQGSRPTRLEFNVRFESELVEFKNAESSQGNSVSGKPSHDVARITVQNPGGGEIIRDDKEEIATLFFNLKSAAKSAKLRCGSVRIFEGERWISKEGSPGWVLVRGEPLAN